MGAMPEFMSRRLLSFCGMSGKLGRRLCPLLSKKLMALYTPDGEAIDIGAIRVQIICGLYFVCGFMDCFSCNIRGLGWSALPSTVSIVGVCGVRLLWIFTLFRMELFHSIFWLIMIYPLSWLVTGIVLMFCYMRIRKEIGKKMFSTKNESILRIS